MAKHETWWILSFLEHFCQTSLKETINILPNNFKIIHILPDFKEISVSFERLIRFNHYSLLPKESCNQNCKLYESYSLMVDKTSFLMEDSSF